VLNGDGTFIAEDALRARLAEHGVDNATRLGAYCGSGVTASITVAALAAAGYPAALFPGSWSEWISDPAHAIARGDN
jgi:thiosulfate/3-mercaptopyruvate sulfurtransferase